MGSDYCPDCRRVTSGDCGKHEPSVTIVYGDPLPNDALRFESTPCEVQILISVPREQLQQAIDKLREADLRETADMLQFGVPGDGRHEGKLCRFCGVQKAAHTHRC